ncbi:MAG: hypothetical protein LBD18_01550 [Treponema sp.]|nr:hypothetical protein [Treponema sp.]
MAFATPKFQILNRLLSSAKGELMILFEKDTVRLSVETSLYPLNRPFLLGLVYGHKFDLSAKSGGLKRHEQTR